ncbi:MAG: AbrB/MazE/SpoVT family DNA-binding domain-containing protein [Nitrososphaerales archaeon]
MSLVKVSSKGQIVIPEEIRRKFRLQKGSLIKIVVEGNKITLMSAIEPPQEAFVSGGPKLVMQTLKESRSSDDKKLRTLLKVLGVKG